MNVSPTSSPQPPPPPPTSSSVSPVFAFNGSGHRHSTASGQMATSNVTPSSTASLSAQKSSDALLALPSSTTASSSTTTIASASSVPTITPQLSIEDEMRTFFKHIDYISTANKYDIDDLDEYCEARAKKATTTTTTTTSASPITTAKTTTTTTTNNSRTNSKRNASISAGPTSASQHPHPHHHLHHHQQPPPPTHSPSTALHSQRTLESSSINNAFSRKRYLTKYEFYSVQAHTWRGGTLVACLMF